MLLRDNEILWREPSVLFGTFYACDEQLSCVFISVCVKNNVPSEIKKWPMWSERWLFYKAEFWKPKWAGSRDYIFVLSVKLLSVNKQPPFDMVERVERSHYGWQSYKRVKKKKKINCKSRSAAKQISRRMQATWSVGKNNTDSCNVARIFTRW